MNVPRENDVCFLSYFWDIRIVDFIQTMSENAHRVLYISEGECLWKANADDPSLFGREGEAMQSCGPNNFFDEETCECDQPRKLSHNE